jgi:hypothetical protein
VGKNRLIHRKYAALTTTTILVYTLLAVNLFTLRAQKTSRTALAPKNAGSNVSWKSASQVNVTESLQIPAKPPCKAAKSTDLWITFCISTGTDCAQSQLCTQPANLSRIGNTAVQRR